MTPTASTAPAGATPRVLVVVSAADRMVDLLHHDAFADDSLNEHFGALMQHFHDTGKPTGLICHAPAALAAAPAAGGRGIYDGYRMTCFKTIVDTLLETIPIARRFPPALKEDPARLLSARGAKVEQTADGQQGRREPRIDHRPRPLLGHRPRQSLRRQGPRRPRLNHAHERRLRARPVVHPVRGHHQRLRGLDRPAVHRPDRLTTGGGRVQ
ncbi:hypothetical protein GCM10010300_86820 [Streptomyces olivaceoviridis]|nr:hypothetical protein GCM10010300_86820 [Streptomyces olivaceoviridis]